jgi:hypothetical protein
MTNPLYPHGRCDACGFGLSEQGLCLDNTDCTRFVGLPRDEDGEIINSASFGQRDWIVEITYHTDFDGRQIDPEKEDHPRTLHGPFFNEAEAEAWMEAYPDGDTDIEDIIRYALNAVRPA